MKGSRKIVEALQNLISEFSLGDKVELDGSSCMGQCQSGVCVTVDGELYSVTPETVLEFFDNNIMSRINER